MPPQCYYTVIKAIFFLFLINPYTRHFMVSCNLDNFTFMFMDHQICHIPFQLIIYISTRLAIQYTAPCQHYRFFLANQLFNWSHLWSLQIEPKGIRPNRGIEHNINLNLIKLDSSILQMRWKDKKKLRIAREKHTIIRIKISLKWIKLLCVCFENPVRLRVIWFSSIICMHFLFVRFFSLAWCDHKTAPFFLIICVCAMDCFIQNKLYIHFDW